MYPCQKYYSSLARHEVNSCLENRHINPSLHSGQDERAQFRTPRDDISTRICRISNVFTLTPGGQYTKLQDTIFADLSG